eukprot:844448-Karenia_brevis.AAC.1
MAQANLEAAFAASSNVPPMPAAPVYSDISDVTPVPMVAGFALPDPLAGDLTMRAIHPPARKRPSS